MESLRKPGIVLLTPTKTSSTLFLTLSPRALPTCAMHIDTLVYGVARDIICMRTSNNKGGKEGGGERRKVGGKGEERGAGGEDMGAQWEPFLSLEQRQGLLQLEATQ